MKFLFTLRQLVHVWRKFSNGQRHKDSKVAKLRFSSNGRLQEN